MDLNTLDPFLEDVLDKRIMYTRRQPYGSQRHEEIRKLLGSSYRMTNFQRSLLDVAPNHITFKLNPFFLARQSLLLSTKKHQTWPYSGTTNDETTMYTVSFKMAIILAKFVT
jgi:hypothetical protein